MDRFKTFLVSHIIGNYDTLGASVVASRQISEPLLTGSVPDLKLNDLIIHFHRFEFLYDVVSKKSSLTKSTPMVLKKFSSNEFCYNSNSVKQESLLTA